MGLAGSEPPSLGRAELIVGLFFLNRENFIIRHETTSVAEGVALRRGATEER